MHIILSYNILNCHILKQNSKGNIKVQQIIKSYHGYISSNGTVQQILEEKNKWKFHKK